MLAHETNLNKVRTPISSADISSGYYATVVFTDLKAKPHLLLLIAGNMLIYLPELIRTDV